jgi:hypothetical protein
MKYVPVSNVYYLAMIMGASDMTTSISYVFLSRIFTTKALITFCSSFLCLSSFVMAITLWV